MQYSKPMIDLILELRRRVPSELKPGIKLANPEVLSELTRYYPSSKDNVTRALIKELMMMAGDEWLARLENPASKPASKSQVKVYRGQTSLAPSKSNPSEAPTPKPQNTGRVYRGQVVYS